MPNEFWSPIQTKKPMVKQILGGGWTNPIEKYATVKFNHFPRDRDEHKEIFETTNQLYRKPCSGLWNNPYITG